MDIKDIFDKKIIDKEVELYGWVKNHRSQVNYGFIDINDGTTFNNLQIVYSDELDNFNDIKNIKVASSIYVKGIIKKSPSSGQDIELLANKIDVIGDVDNDYPLQTKGRPTREFLRDIAHLRVRTNLFRAVFKIRSVAAFAIHEYFNKNNYLYVHTPIITNADCEGDSQMFKITTMDLANIPKIDGLVDYKKDLFSTTSFITGSGQLHGETFVGAFKKIYTFGPTFRTEKSNTKVHANEFWMIEPEIAFCSLDNLMDIEEEMLKYVVKYVLDNACDELKFLDKFVSTGLIDKLTKLINSKFTRITHKECIDILKKADIEFEFIPDYKSDIQKEHEKYITEYFNGPVFITNWPKDIKAWYMKENNDGLTVQAVDLEVPGSGELMGGSVREEDYVTLLKRAKSFNVDTDKIKWYLDLRRFGTSASAGFGMGFERLIIYLTGIENIRDVIPYPRTPGNLNY